jgi:hypothetical protein
VSVSSWFGCGDRHAVPEVGAALADFWLAFLGFLLLLLVTMAEAVGLIHKFNAKNDSR